jgi:hypothetical protein
MTYASGFGAVGDGVADDTAALQHALDDGGATLRLAAGTYRITRPLVIDLTRRGYSAVQGEHGTARLLMAGPGPALRIMGDHRGTAVPHSVTPQTWERERFPAICGLEIVGDHPEAVGIELRKTTKAVVSQVLVRRCRIGVHLVERNRDFMLADAHLYDNREYGLLFDQCNLHQAIVHGCHISWNTLAGIRAVGGETHNLQIVGNDIEYNNLTADGRPPDPQVLAAHPGGAEILFECRTGRVSEVTISGNTIQATPQRGGANIRIMGADVGPPPAADAPREVWQGSAFLVAVTGNVLGSQWRAVELAGVCRATFTGNTIYGATDHAVVATRSTGLVFSGNTLGWQGRDFQTIPPGEGLDGLRFEDCDNVVLSGLATQRLGGAGDAAAITLLRCRDSSVSDCQLLDPLHGGVDLVECERCRVANNTIVDRRDRPRMAHAVRIGGGSRHTLVTGNIVGGATVAPILAAAGTADVRDNLVVT